MMKKQKGQCKHRQGEHANTQLSQGIKSNAGETQMTEECKLGPPDSVSKTQNNKETTYKR